MALGMGSGLIHDGQLSSNSISGWATLGNSNYFPPWRARLGNDPTEESGRESFYWKPASSTDVWIQVDLIFVHEIVGVGSAAGTHSTGSTQNFISTAKFLYSTTDPFSLQTYQDVAGTDTVIKSK